MHLAPLAAADAADIDALLDEAFGLERVLKTAYRLREGSQPLGAASFAARAPDGYLCGAISLWPIQLAGEAGATPALLLGPVAVARRCQGQGLGARLIETSLAAARALGHDIVMLVGDAHYYGRFGFSNRETGAWRLPGPVDQQRVMALSLAGSALPAGPLAVTGPAQQAGSARPTQQAGSAGPGQQQAGDEQQHRPFRADQGGLIPADHTA